MGSPTVSGRWTKVGRTVNWNCTIAPSTSIHSVQGVSLIDGLAAAAGTPAVATGCFANDSNAANALGSGVLTPLHLFPPTIPVTGATITFNGTYDI